MGLAVRIFIIWFLASAFFTFFNGRKCSLFRVCISLS